VGERAVAVVVIENAPPIAEDQQVGKSVIVIVTHRNPHAEQPLSADPGSSSDVAEGAISVVPVKRASQGVFRAVRGGGCAVDQIEIEPSVLVIVNPAATRAHGFDQILLRRKCVVMSE